MMLALIAGDYDWGWMELFYELFVSISSDLLKQLQYFQSTMHVTPALFNSFFIPCYNNKKQKSEPSTGLGQTHKASSGRDLGAAPRQLRCVTFITRQMLIGPVKTSLELCDGGQRTMI